MYLSTILNTWKFITKIHNKSICFWLPLTCKLSICVCILHFLWKLFLSWVCSSSYRSKYYFVLFMLYMYTLNITIKTILLQLLWEFLYLSAHSINNFDFMITSFLLFSSSIQVFQIFLDFYCYCCCWCCLYFKTMMADSHPMKSSALTYKTTIFWIIFYFSHFV